MRADTSAPQPMIRATPVMIKPRLASSLADLPGIAHGFFRAVTHFSGQTAFRSPGASGGIADAVADGESGILVDPTDLQQATDAVRHLLGDAALAQRIGAVGRERVLRGFTWERVVGELRGIARELGRK